MPTIYDNMRTKLEDGLNETLKVCHKSDFCVGYFNLRGWRKIASNIDKWSGEENNQCRLMIGMQKSGRDIIREYFNIDRVQDIDRRKAKQIEKQLAREFREQLTIGFPTNEDEIGLRILK